MIASAFSPPSPPNRPRTPLAAAACNPDAPSAPLPPSASESPRERDLSGLTAVQEETNVTKRFTAVFVLCTTR